MMLIVALRKLTSKQKQNIKEHYKTLVFDRRLHLRKSIDKLICEVLIVELDLSRVFSVSKNVVYKWLKEQNIIDITTAFIYESTKYKKLFDKHVNFFVRSFPELFKKNIEEKIKDKELKDETVKSKYEPHNDARHDNDNDNDIDIDIATLPIEKRLQIIEVRLEALEKLIADPINEKSTDDKLAKGEKKKSKIEYKLHEEKNNFIIKSSDDVVVITYPFKNRIEKRKMSKKAQNFLNNLLCGDSKA